MFKFNLLDDVMSCFNRAEEKEPLFVLKASDSIAPKVVRLWCQNYHSKYMAGGPPIHGTEEEKHEYHRRLLKLKDAYHIADCMEEWYEKRHHPKPEHFIDVPQSIAVAVVPEPNSGNQSIMPATGHQTIVVKS